MVPPFSSSTAQFTVLSRIPTTVATKVCISPANRVAFAGSIVTVTFANGRTLAWPYKRWAQASTIPTNRRGSIFTPETLAFRRSLSSTSTYALVCDHGYHCSQFPAMRRIGVASESGVRISSSLTASSAWVLGLLEQVLLTIEWRLASVPTENSAQLWRMSFPQPKERGSSSSRLCLSPMNEIRRCTRVQGSTVQTLISKGQGEAARSAVDSGFSGSPSFVAVMQSTDLRHRHDGPHLRRLNRSWLR